MWSTVACIYCTYNIFHKVWSVTLHCYVGIAPVVPHQILLSPMHLFTSSDFWLHLVRSLVALVSEEPWNETSVSILEVWLL